MAGYPYSVARMASPQMVNSKAQPKARSRQMGMQNAAARKLQKASKKGKLKAVAANTGSY